VTPPDSLGALLPEPAEPVAGASEGPLAGTTFVAKDLFDVAGTVTGAGQAQWAATHPPATANAPAVQRLLDAGSVLVGKAKTSEMAFSLSADNVHTGMPVNPAAPDREPGGSSSGSAAAVAGGLCDLGLGSDTLGSVRVPSSYCGIHGWRPTHGLVPDDAVHPLAPSFDTVGLLARDPALLARAAEVLAGRPLGPDRPLRLLLAADAFPLVGAAVVDRLLTAAEALEPVGSADLCPPGLTLHELLLAFRDLQGPEFAAAHGDWIAATSPTFGPGVAQRVAYALAVTPEQQAAAAEVRAEVRNHVLAVLEPGDALVLPAAGVPSRREAPPAERDEARNVAAALSVVASMAGAPAVTFPAVRTEEAPIGLCVLGRPGSDGGLLSWLARRPPVPPASGPGSA
jgi:amidase